ncbi:Translation machinery-associated protein 46 [Glugoides intestinalis]
MSKVQTGNAKQQKQKTPKEMIKILEEQLFGEKNKAKKKEIQTMIKKFELELELDKKKRNDVEEAKKNTIVKQLIPVGVDPKTVQCINFLNNNCDKGDACQFGHILKKEEKKESSTPQLAKQKVICRFLIDAMNNGEYSKNWKCPLPTCIDVHKLIELTDNQEVEVSLEEYIELQRQTVDESGLTPVTEATFTEWRAKKQKEEELHAKRVAALSGSIKGIEMFSKNPEMFDDDDEVGDEINYAERNYEVSEEEEVIETLAED